MTNNEIKPYLMNIALDNNISVVFFDTLDPYTPPATDIEARCIAMNSRWHNKSEIPFQLAHELGHILSGQQSTKILYFTPYKYGMELEANEYAISLLLPMYLEDKNKEDINVHRFMDTFSIPYHLEDVVIQEINSVLN
ncbi:hypothetical protein CPR19092_LGOLGGFK_01047 [Companilactobacillus paralimentarius]|uniref:ImmA/IrrE family metallo-endopeptidase n=1 Tax=Companilactobacillus paralimentarius TaxID=83526 RepID=UPI003851604D